MVSEQIKNKLDKEESVEDEEKVKIDQSPQGQIFERGNLIDKLRRIVCAVYNDNFEISSIE